MRINCSIVLARAAAVWPCRISVDTQREMRLNHVVSSVMFYSRDGRA